MDKNSTLKEAISLRADDRLEESNELLLKLAAEYPDDPQVLFEVGGSFDLLGFANDAIPHYRRAIDEGLTGPDLQECFICFGICQRAVGDLRRRLIRLRKRPIGLKTTTLLKRSLHWPCTATGTSQRPFASCWKS